MLRPLCKIPAPLLWVLAAVAVRTVLSRLLRWQLIALYLNFRLMGLQEYYSILPAAKIWVCTKLMRPAKLSLNLFIQTPRLYSVLLSIPTFRMKLELQLWRPALMTVWSRLRL